jgi:hypothetical protein
MHLHPWTRGFGQIDGVMRTYSGSDDAPIASPAWFNAWRQQTQMFEDVSAFRFSLFGLTGSAETEPISATVREYI